MSMDRKFPHTRLRILYVGRDRDLDLLYSGLSHKEGHQYAAFSSAEEGVDQAGVIAPHIILCDPTMTGMDVQRFVGRIREKECDVFILVTGKDEKAGNPDAMITAGADDYLEGPLTMKRLSAKFNIVGTMKKLRHEGDQSDKKIEEILEQRDKASRELADVREELAGEKEVLQNSMKQIALMVEERAQANRKIEKLEDLMAKTRENIVLMLAEMVESKPQFRRGHAAGVKELSSAIARFLDLGEGEIGDIEKAALLHELGKISIPDELAMKDPLAYSELEQDLLIRHPVKGAAFLEKFPGLERVAQVVKHIHENVDGTGFPDGLKRNRIPMGARIIAVAGAYDNLVSGSSPLSSDRALDVIEKEIGTRYDSRAVNGLRKYVGRKVEGEGGKVVEKRLFEVKPGMVLAAGIFTVSGAMLLPENTVLTEEFIKQIAKYNKIDPLEETVYIKE